MIHVRSLILLAFWLVPLQSFAGKDKDQAKDKLDEWRPIEQWENQIKDVPGDPGAPAIQLYYGLTRDDVSQFEFVYSRIKVLNEKGKEKEYSDVAIELGDGVVLADLKARTIHPDGTIIDFNGHVFDKTILKSRWFKVSGKAFSFPQVTVGSILEYRYRVTWSGHFVYDSTWLLQHNLYTAREEFCFRPFQGPLNTKGGGTGRVAMAYLNQLSEVVPQLSGGAWRLNLEKVPAMVQEDYAPPDDEYKPLVFFYYGGREIASPDQFWQEMGKIWTDSAERFIDNFKEVQDAAASATSGESDPEKKLRKLYLRAQQIRNLSFERQRTQEELKKEGLSLAANAAELMKRQYGTHFEINRLFVALARAAGFQAFMMRAANRENFAFNKNILFAGQLESEIAAVELNGKLLFFDPGTRFCPFGLLRWTNTAVPALRLGKDGGGFVDIPAPLPTDSATSRVSEVSVDATGRLQGELTVQFRGEEALEYRLDGINTDDAGRKKALEDELVHILPTGAMVKLQEAHGWDDQDQPLVARFSLEIQEFASVTGKRLVAPAFLFQSRPRKMFTAGYRKSPIVLPYAFSEADTLKMKLPETFSLEHPPHERKTALYDASYEMRNSFSGNLLVIKRSLSLNGTRFGQDRFVEMKEFFDVVQAGDEGQAIMQQGSGQE